MREREQDRRKGKGRGRGRGRGGGQGRRRGRGRGDSHRRGSRPGSSNQEIPFQWAPFSAAEENKNTDAKFSGNEGPSTEAKQQREPLDYFYLLFDVLDLIAEETNRYARATNFTPVTKKEMAAFIGINIAMGIVDLPRVSDFWSTDPILQHPWFRTVMSRNRFLEISRYLHFNDNSKQQSSPPDKLFKVRPVIESLSSAFAAHYVPSRNISIDEQMIGTKCRVSFIQYLPKKPKKWGIKVWVLADSSNGYVPKFEIYTGASERVEHGLSYSVVMRLMQPYLGKGYRLYVDNFYSSPILFQDLLSQGTFACGTVRANRRGLPPLEHIARGEANFMKCDDLTFVHWKDKRDVLCLSTFHGNGMEDFSTRRRGTEEIQRPVLITDYNKNMGGVDRMDQMLVYYALGRKTLT